jgi:hypothetical protein
MQDIDVLLNSSWWTTALLQRRALDVAAHTERRAQQSVDPHAVYEPADPEAEVSVERPKHGSDDYTLTAWEREWLTARINDAHLLHLNARDEGRAVLQESAEDHEARELRQKAIDYFGAPHDQTRENFKKQKAQHEVFHQRVKVRLAGTDPNAQPVEHDTMTQTLAAHEQTIKQLADYDTLIDRHVATVKADVAEQRRLAQEKVDKCTKLLSVPHPDQVAVHHQRVEAELRTSKA